MTNKQAAIHHYEQKHNISIIYDNNERTYTVYQHNRLLGYVSSLSDIDNYMEFKNQQVK